MFRSVAVTALVALGLHRATARAGRRRAVDDEPAAGPPRGRGGPARVRASGFEDGRFYANGWHTTGEMGGVWAPPMKLVDGVWFGVDGQWIGPATKFTSGWGYTRYDLPDARRAQLAAHRLRARRPPRAPCSGCGYEPGEAAGP